MKAAKKSLVIVIKLGTSSICDETSHAPLISNLSNIVETVVKLRKEGHKVVIVSSGGIGMGLRRMDLDKRPKRLPAVQAIAAIGQSRLMALYDDLFEHLRQPVAQILLTRNDIADRTQYLNAANTLNELLQMGVVPIVNENDTIAVSEIKFGDNDTLSALTSGMVNADYLFLMTDVDCLYTSNPRKDPNAKPIQVVHDISQLKADVTSSGSRVGTGGMVTKIIAAELATSVGVTTVIARGSEPQNIFEIVDYISKQSSRPDVPLAVEPNFVGEPPLHTCFVPKPKSIGDRGFWLSHGLSPRGKIFVDKGAYHALSRTERAALLPSGILQVEGSFSAQQAVDLFVSRRLENGNVEPLNPISFGRALVNYSSIEINKIKGLKSSLIESVLSYADSDCVAYRENIAIKNIFPLDEIT
ncbi:putative glutamate 5-kinase [Neolecta irregularis DAH-3]|uniref:Putative glutamate 5-kinase n=1 Tax=Neolecta irregularis (strain DAH-3) TaxID=1198029 RepID=A0A1U7LKT1_NEOID|nr:putative glutamate 5-kinase [Neolecta irregularis DAH-3]|eukprot:OLL23257.1 putative glutamate 5-kinase [Neolecta irregularis DAH-3]